MKLLSNICSTFIFGIYGNKIFYFFIIEEILESIRAKKGEIDVVKSSEEIEKDNSETENNSKDAEKSRDEFEDQSLEKDSDDKTPDDDPEQGKSEGKKITWLKRNSLLVLFMKSQILLANENESFFITSNYLILQF